jgi:hypothetical protein
MRQVKILSGIYVAVYRVDSFQARAAVTNRLHSGKPPMRGVTASLGPSSVTLGGPAREQYAAMEAGGGAVEVPPQKGAPQRPASLRGEGASPRGC